MNSGGTPFAKRKNPFAENNGTTSIVEEQKSIVEEQKVIQEQPKNVSYETTTNHQQNKVNSSKNNVSKPIDDNNREKYTATMEKTLRKRVKIAAAMAGIQVSTFIEEACLEKLEREGQ